MRRLRLALLFALLIVLSACSVKPVSDPGASAPTAAKSAATGAPASTAPATNAAAPAAPANPDQPAADAKPPADPPHEGLPNFATVVKNIYRGGAPTAQGLKSLKTMGVKTIIDLRIEGKHKAEEKQAKAMGFNYVSLTMDSQAPTKKQVQTLLANLDKAETAPVYVHCQHGSDRTGCMIGLYRVMRQGWDFDKTYKEMKHYYFNTKLSHLKGTVESAAKGNKTPGR